MYYIYPTTFRSHISIVCAIIYIYYGLMLPAATRFVSLVRDAIHRGNWPPVSTGPQGILNVLINHSRSLTRGIPSFRVWLQNVYCGPHIYHKLFGAYSQWQRPKPCLCTIKHTQTLTVSHRAPCRGLTRRPVSRLYGSDGDTAHAIFGHCIRELSARRFRLLHTALGRRRAT